MKKAKRVFLIVLDSVGIGYEPDAQLFGDVGANTMKSISSSAKFNIPNLISLGLSHIDGVDYLPKVDKPLATVGRLQEESMGKDTTIGHWEICGIVSKTPLPTYPDGFPKELLDEFSRRVGRGVLCNKPYSGTDVIRDYGDEHLRTGDLIVYTSADSVFQIAAHEDLIPLEKLYDYCKIARELLVGEHGVGRVIARPFTTKDGVYTRTANRHDYSLIPPRATVLNALRDNGKDVIAIGKITDIFAGSGITQTIFTHGNAEGIEKTIECTKRDFEGLCFTNLVDFDMLYGHRQDKDGYAEALSYFDKNLPLIMENLGEDDCLIITADHGCDPADKSTDHTREYIPFILYRKGEKVENLGTKLGFYNIATTVAELLDVPYTVEK